ncbi:hypothetical protein [Lactobacillus bombicola]|uniref:hypothetical protein n=1 Tax=Lactobacillus bombicola TaxID=1505723 RepID=UPI000E57F4B2|nr:hypothetical protein [Lactobacillus bombicola]RHW50596.1 hypothetical protein DS833_04795 [Lactobacillus bombicola]
MFENKLSNKVAFFLCGLMQMFMGIVFLFIESKKYHFVYFIIFILCAVLFFFTSFYPKISFKKNAKKDEMSAIDNGDQILGMISCLLGLITIIIIKDPSSGLLAIDFGFCLLILPPANKR